MKLNNEAKFKFNYPEFNPETQEQKEIRVSNLVEEMRKSWAQK